MSTQPPAGIMPMISVDSVDAVRDFYVEKLGFAHKMGVVGKDGSLDFVNVTLGANAMMFMRAPKPEEGNGARRSVEIYMGVDDVDAYHEQVSAKGVKVTDPLTDQWWGDRTFVVEDPNHYRVWFHTNVADPVPPPGMKMV